MLYRDSLDDAISMLRVVKPGDSCRRKKSSPKKPCYGRGRDLFCPGGYAAQHTVGEFQRNKKKVGLVVNEYGDIQGW